VSVDWTEYDANSVLALALFRWQSRKSYATPGGWRAELRTLVYSNGTEHGFAQEAADTLLELGPVLHLALLAGIRELSQEPWFEEYTSALAAGDHEQIVELEDQARPKAEAEAAR
jgi:hypothetical protein